MSSVMDLSESELIDMFSLMEEIGAHSEKAIARLWFALSRDRREKLLECEAVADLIEKFYRYVYLVGKETEAEW